MKRILLPLLLAACDAGPTAGASDDLTSIGGTAKSIEWDSFVYAQPGDDDGAIAGAIARQVKSSLGALREKSIGTSDLNAHSNLDPAGWKRETLTAVDASGQPKGTLVRVRYHYKDTALVGKKTDPGSAVSFTMLFGDYLAGSAALQPACVDDATEADSLWYHFQPGQAACQRLISAETDTINAELAKLADPTGQLAPSDAARRFVTVRAKLTAIAAAPTKYPEYDRLWGFGSDRAKLVVYAFVGVEHDLGDTHDISATEFQRLLQTLRRGIPSLSVVDTQPFGMLLDFWNNGQKVPAGWDDVANWMINDSGYPAGVDPESLRKQVVANFSERWIVWQAPVTVTRGSETRQMTLEIRTYWGKEDGDPTSRQHATWRYLEAFWHGDVFAYAGHSHFGHGPLEPYNYSSANFPQRYQVMLVNSCLSYNYYDLDFINMHPGHEANLDIVMNGLPAYWNGMGESTGRYLLALVDGSGKSWSQLLDSMKVNDPWGAPGYEPMRGVNGELDNKYDPSASVTVRY
jgi:hypothetical protein